MKKYQDDYVKITNKALSSLIEGCAQVAFLEGGGVKNWTWYSDSIREGLQHYLLPDEIYSDTEYETLIGRVVEEGYQSMIRLKEIIEDDSLCQ